MSEEVKLPRYEALLKRLDLPKPLDRKQLKLALTHSSVNEAYLDNPKKNQWEPDNERLEFLGDAVLKLAVSHYLYEIQPTANEGTLSKMTAYLVSDKTLADVALQIGLGRYIRLGPKEKSSGGDQKKSILASTLEAVIGTVFLATDYPTAAAMTLRLLTPQIQEALAGKAETYNFKASLQEYTQSEFKCLPDYVVKRDGGPSHAPKFSCQVMIKGELYGSGQGTTIKMAQQQAAEEALKKLGQPT